MESTEDTLPELAAERRFGGMGTEIEREIPRIDLSDFDGRREEIVDALWRASTDIGFFQLVNHGIAPELVEAAFARAEAFFALEADAKARRPLRPGTNAGWEHTTQVRPSTGTVDRKESYQITRPRMNALWPDEDEIPDFRATMLAFESANRALGMRVLDGLGERLGLASGFFAARHDPASVDYQSTLRLLHYLDMRDARPDDFDAWRAGAHTDFGCLTLLHQLPGQGGLQVCPGHDVAEGAELAWTPVPPDAGVVTCNIGDMLTRWSGGRLRSTLHRVRMPEPDGYLGPRYSIAFFCQADRDAVIEDTTGTHPPITAHDYLQRRIAANFKPDPA